MIWDQLSDTCSWSKQNSIRVYALVHVVATPITSTTTSFADTTTNNNTPVNFKTSHLNRLFLLQR